MANWNNNYYPSRNSYGTHGGPQGNNRNYNQKNAPPDITPERLPADAIDRAEQVMAKMNAKNLTTSKIRNILSLFTEIYNDECVRNEPALAEESISKLQMARIRLVYEAGREPAVNAFTNETKLLKYLKYTLSCEASREEFIRLFHYVEALVAYHRFYGGKD